VPSPPLSSTEVAQTGLATVQQERAQAALLCFQNVLQLERQAVDVQVRVCERARRWWKHQR
jgi:hypothetical protein